MKNKETILLGGLAGIALLFALMSKKASGTVAPLSTSPVVPAGTALGASLSSVGGYQAAQSALLLATMQPINTSPMNPASGPSLSDDYSSFGGA